MPDADVVKRLEMALGGACFGLAWRIGARRDLALTHSALLDWCSAIHFGLAAKMDAGHPLSGRIIFVMLLLLV